MDFRADIVALHTDAIDPSTGILRGRAVLAKEGIYTYSDGTRTWREYTPASVLTDRAWLDSLRLSPVTLNHPQAMVTADNAKGLAVGAIGDTVITQGDRITSPIVVWDRDATNAARSSHREISCGYHAQTVDEPGTWNGQHYDSKQVRRMANHVALVDRGRHGPDVRVSFDAADGAAPAPVAVADLGDLGADDMKTIEELTAELAAVTTRADGAEAERDALKGKIDAMAKGDKCDACGGPTQDGKFCADGAREEIKARVELEAKAGAEVKDYKADGKSDRQIRLDVLAAWGVKVDEARSDEYVSARFDAETDARAGKRSATDLIADAASRATNDAAQPQPSANQTMRGHWGL